MNNRNWPSWLRGLNRDWLLHGSGQVLLIGLASRLLVFTSAIVGFSVFGVRQSLPNENLWSINVPVVNLFCRWDTAWYAQIALHGYPPGSSPVAQVWNWFPLYPVTMRGVGSVFQIFLSPTEAVMVAGFLVSNALFFVSLMLFYKLSAVVLGSRRLAVAASIFFCFWPGALFYSAAYSESLFMALALGAFYFLEKGDGWKSTLLGFLAGFAKGNAFLICIPFFVSGLQKRRAWQVLQSAVVASPYLLFSLYGYFSTGLFPVRENVYRTYWGTLPPLLTQLSGTINMGYAVLYSVESLLIVFPFVFLTFDFLRARSFWWVIKAEGSAVKYWALSLVVLVTILFYSEMFGIHRYAMAMLPLYWVPAKVWGRSRALGVVLLGTTTTILVIGTVLFVTWNYFL
ncbi:MAG: mannosyltransferase family protein [Candidatus Bathyarchaeia archaeon]